MGITAMYFTPLNQSLLFVAKQNSFHLTREISWASRCQFCMNFMPLLIFLSFQLSLRLSYGDGYWCQQPFLTPVSPEPFHVHAVYAYLRSLGRAPNRDCSQACCQHIAEVKPPGCNKKFCPRGKKRDGDKKHLSFPVTIIVSWFLLS